MCSPVRGTPLYPRMNTPPPPLTGIRSPDPQAIVGPSPGTNYRQLGGEQSTAGKSTAQKLPKIGSLIGNQSQWITKIANFCKNCQFLAPGTRQPYSFGAWSTAIEIRKQFVDRLCNALRVCCQGHACENNYQESPRQTKPQQGPKQKVHEFRLFLWILVFFFGKARAIHIELLFRCAPGKSSWTGLSLVWFAGVAPEINGRQSARSTTTNAMENGAP